MKRTKPPATYKIENRHDSHRPQQYHCPSDNHDSAAAPATESKNEHSSNSTMHHRLNIKPVHASDHHASSPSHPAVSPSSRASEQGRRLAQERQKNHQLLQQVHELQHQVDRLEQTRHVQNVDASSSVRDHAADEKSMQSKNGPYLNHIHELQNALQLETERRIRAERELADSFLRNMAGTGTTMPSTTSATGTRLNNALEDELDYTTYRQNAIVNTSHPTDCFDSDNGHNSHPMDCSKDHNSYNKHVANLLERAKFLLHDSHNSSSSSDDINDDPTETSQHYMLTYDPSYQPNTMRKGPLIRELMKEFQSLLEGFYIEQRHKADEKLQTTPNHEDILWLFEELEWRFEEIRRGYEEEWARWNEGSMHGRTHDSLQNEKRVESLNVNEWKSCLKGLMEVVASCDRGIGNPNSHCVVAMQDEVNRLRRKLSSITKHHEQKCRGMNGEIQTIQHHHKSESEEKSKTIEMLESKIAEQNETIASLQQDIEREKSVLDNERQTHTSSKESMTARIHYLEGIVRSLKEEVKEEKMRRSRGLMSPSKDFPSSHNAVEFQQAPSPYANYVNDGHDMSHFSHDSLNNGDTHNPSRREKDADSNIVFGLQEQIEELGAALEESEEERAKIIEEFQFERENYIRQYKEMSDILKQFLDGDNLKCNCSQQL
eukprot:CCRYP_017432-RA/>CCRYP_017432-RA protein AED:0.07 eAED:0.07 QI:0/-1/0/1/-1/1/1/0/659